MLLNEFKNSGGDGEAPRGPEWEYIDRHPSQAGEILGYLAHTPDPDKFRADLQSALDNNTELIFQYLDNVLDMLPLYELRNGNNQNT